MVIINELNEKIDSVMDDYMHSRTDENSVFIDGVAYGMCIAKAIISNMQRNVINKEE